MKWMMMRTVVEMTGMVVVVVRLSAWRTKEPNGRFDHIQLIHKQ